MYGGGRRHPRETPPVREQGIRSGPDCCPRVVRSRGTFVVWRWPGILSMCLTIQSTAPVTTVDYESGIDPNQVRVLGFTQSVIPHIELLSGEPLGRRSAFRVPYVLIRCVVQGQFPPAGPASGRRRRSARVVVLRGIHSGWVLMNVVLKNAHLLGLSLESLILSVQSVGQDYHKGDECHLEPNQSERPGDSPVATEKSKRRVKL